MTTALSCAIAGEFLNCPFSDAVAFPPNQATVFGEIQCPIDAIDQFDLIGATQASECECIASVTTEDSNDPAQSMECACVACPPDSALTVATACTQAIIGTCFAFDCDGNCVLEQGEPTMATTIRDLQDQDALNPSPVTLWNNTINTEFGGLVRGNGLVLSPDGDRLFATSVSGAVTAFDVETGNIVWDYNPIPAAEEVLNSRSRPVFANENSDDEYFVYSIESSIINSGDPATT